MGISLLFDLDGTLIDSCPGIAASLAVAFRAAGRAIPTTDLRAIIGPPVSIMARGLEPGLSDTEVSHIEAAFRSDYDTAGWQKTVLFDGVAETLEALHRAGTRMFIVTNKPRIPTTRILSHLDILDSFAEIVTPDSRTPRYDSKSAMVSDLLLRRSLSSADTILVGDTAEDEAAAAANDLRFIYAAYGYGSIDAPACPIASFAELRSVLSAKGPSRKA